MAGPIAKIYFFGALKTKEKVPMTTKFEGGRGVVQP